MYKIIDDKKEQSQESQRVKMSCSVEETNSLFQYNLLWQNFEGRRRRKSITFTQNQITLYD